MERLTITGLADKSEQVVEGLGDKGETSIIDSVGNILIIRALSGRVGAGAGRIIKITPENEIARRYASCILYKEYLPQYVLKTDSVVLQGFCSKDDKNQGSECNRPVVILGRFTEKLREVNSVSEMKIQELNSDLIQAIIAINTQFLKILFEKDIIVDTGGGKNFGRELGSLVSWFTKRLTINNIMIGITKEGEKKVFVDPDWYILPGEDGQNPNIQRAKKYIILLTTILFFESLSIFREVSGTNQVPVFSPAK